MQLSVRDFTSLVGGMKTAVQTAATQAINLTVGSTLRALLEATATVGIWFQWLILQVLCQTRLATSYGSDADSWGADFTFTRLPGVDSVGFVTFSRYSSATQALILPGTQVLTTGAAAAFAVTLDTTQPSWNGTGYLLPIGTASLTLPVSAVLPGATGNILAGAITLLGQAVSGVDTVTNALPFTGGVNAESDAAFKVRFQAFVNTRTSGTSLAIFYAAVSVQAGLTVSVLENQPQVGFTTVVVDDGSGHPPTALLNSVAAACNVVRPLGSVISVQGPFVIYASIGITLNLNPSASRPTLVNEVSAAVAAYVASLPVGGALSFGKLATIVYSTDPINIYPGTTILLNGGSTDLVPLSVQVVRASALSVA